MTLINSLPSNTARGYTKASAAPTDLASARHVVINALMSGSGLAGTFYEGGASAAVFGSFALFSGSSELCGSSLAEAAHRVEGLSAIAADDTLDDLYTAYFAL